MVEQRRSTHEESLRQTGQRKQEAILDFLSELPTVLVIQFGEQAYRLVHAAPIYLYETCNYKDWDEQTFFVWYRVDRRDKLREDKVLVFGHTPTFRFDYELPVHTRHGQNRIGIDCGCGHGTGCRLVCLRLRQMLPHPRLFDTGSNLLQELLHFDLRFIR